MPARPWRRVCLWSTSKDSLHYWTPKTAKLTTSGKMTPVSENAVFRPVASTADRSYHHAFMPTFALIVIVLVLLPLVVYRMVNAAGASLLVCLATAAASVLVVVFVFVRGFRVGEAV